MVGPQAQAVAGQLPPFFAVTTVQPDAGTEQATTLLRDNHDDVAIVTGSQPVQALVDGSNLFAAQSSVAVLNKMGGAVHTTILFNPQLKTSWVDPGHHRAHPDVHRHHRHQHRHGPRTADRHSGTTGGDADQAEFGDPRQDHPYFLVAAIDLAIVTGVGMALFGVPFNGNPFAFALGAALFPIRGARPGVFISTISQNAGQAIQTAFFFLLPQILLSGMIFPLDAMAAGCVGSVTCCR